MTTQIETITLTQKEFDALPEYSCSLPTGTTIGKKWKKNIYAFVRGTDRQEWYLHEYVEHKDPGMVGITTKQIIAIIKLKSYKNKKHA